MNNAAEFLRVKVKITYIAIIFLFALGFLTSFVPWQFFQNFSESTYDFAQVILVTSLLIQLLTFSINEFGTTLTGIKIFYYGGYVFTVLGYGLTYIQPVKDAFRSCSFENSIIHSFCLFYSHFFISILSQTNNITLGAFIFWLNIFIPGLIITKIFLKFRG